MRDDISALKATIEQLKSELSWVKQTLAMLLKDGPKPAEHPEKSSPPIVGPLLVAAVGAIGTILAASPPW